MKSFKIKAVMMLSLLLVILLYIPDSLFNQIYPSSNAILVALPLFSLIKTEASSNPLSCSPPGFVRNFASPIIYRPFFFITRSIPFFNLHFKTLSANYLSFLSLPFRINVLVLFEINVLSSTNL